ncbi:hypothetical protein TRFO_26595 [Tritrichomonas foetus]|uniref:HECT-type E3 ubiquitin transferase n=1 Tax=Tritrichomonas foetus TaxID=1144522 RepID=A0A1J4K2C2_9EUKA|nr:hypothetical protein TRFO_26595 [Tritrichomonas foetus]|eukprot:OHT05593.1 hypothetical protein TRFO_26595 [Tritrichomonas foetus]
MCEVFLNSDFPELFSQPEKIRAIMLNIYHENFENEEKFDSIMNFLLGLAEFINNGTIQNGENDLNPIIQSFEYATKEILVSLIFLIQKIKKPDFRYNLCLRYLFNMKYTSLLILKKYCELLFCITILYNPENNKSKLTLEEIEDNEYKKSPDENLKITKDSALTDQQKREQKNKWKENSNLIRNSNLTENYDEINKGLMNACNALGADLFKNLFENRKTTQFIELTNPEKYWKDFENVICFSDFDLDDYIKDFVCITVQAIYKFIPILCVQKHKPPWNELEEDVVSLLYYLIFLTKPKFSIINRLLSRFYFKICEFETLPIKYIRFLAYIIRKGELATIPYDKICRFQFLITLDRSTLFLFLKKMNRSFYHFNTDYLKVLETQKDKDLCEFVLLRLIELKLYKNEVDLKSATQHRPILDEDLGNVINLDLNRNKNESSNSFEKQNKNEDKNENESKNKNESKNRNEDLVNLNNDSNEENDLLLSDNLVGDGSVISINIINFSRTCNKIIQCCDFLSFNHSVWEKLSKIYEINLDTSIVKEVAKFLPTEISIRLTNDPYSCFPENIINDLANSSTDMNILNRLMSKHQNQPPFNTLDFWVRYIRNFKLIPNTPPTFNVFSQLLGMNTTLQYMLSSNSFSVSNILFHDNIEPNKNMCLFFSQWMKTTGKKGYWEYSFNDLLLKHSTKPYNPLFWSLFSNKKLLKIYRKCSSEVEPYIYYGLSTTRLTISRLKNQNEIKFPKLDETDKKFILSLLHPIDQKVLELPTLPQDINKNLLLFISSTQMTMHLKIFYRPWPMIFEDSEQFFIYLALLIRLLPDIRKSNKINLHNFFSECNFTAEFTNALNNINNESNLLFINIFFEILMVKLNSYGKDFYKLSFRIIDVLWKNAGDERIRELIPKFDEFFLKLYKSFHGNISNAITFSFPKFWDFFSAKMLITLFESYKNIRKLDLDILKTQSCPYICKFRNTEVINTLLKDPTPELFTFLFDFCKIDQRVFSECNFDQTAVIDILFFYLNLNSDQKNVLQSILESLTHEQKLAILDKYHQNISYESLLENLIESIQKNNEITNQLLQNKYYLEFIQNNILEMSEKLLGLFENSHNHVLFENGSFKATELSQISIYDIVNDSILQKLDYETLFKIDNYICTFNGNSKENRVIESLTYLINLILSFIIHGDEIPTDIQEFFSKFDSLKEIYNKVNKIDNILMLIFTDILTYQCEDDLKPLLNTEQYEKLISVSPIIQKDDLQTINSLITFVFQYCNNSLGQLSANTLLKLTQIDDTKCLSNFWKIFQLQITRDSAETLFLLNLILSSSSESVFNQHFLKKLILDYHKENLQESAVNHIHDLVSRIFLKIENQYFLNNDALEETQYKYPPRPILNMINNFINFIPRSNFALALMSVFMIRCPFLFTMNPIFDPINFFVNLVKIHTKDTKKSFLIIFLCFELLKIKNFSDILLQHILENLMNSDRETTLLYLILILQLLYIKTYQQITLNYLIRFDFIQLSEEILLKFNKNEEIGKWILQIFFLIIRAFSNERKNMSDIILMISKVDSPFKSLIDRRLSTHQSYLIPSLLPNKEYQNWFEVLNSLIHFQYHSYDFFLDIKDIKIEDNIPNVSVISLAPPPDISPEFFQHLPISRMCEILNDRMPRIRGMLNTRMYEYLLNQPGWISEWLYHRPNCGLLPHQYSKVAEVIEQLNQFIGEKPLGDYSYSLNWKTICRIIFYHYFDYLFENLHLVNMISSYFNHKHECEELLKQIALKILKTENVKFPIFLKVFKAIKLQIRYQVLAKVIEPQYRNDIPTLVNILYTYRDETFRVNTPSLREIQYIRDFYNIVLGSNHSVLMYQCINLTYESDHANGNPKEKIMNEELVRNTFANLIKSDKIRRYKKFLIFVCEKFPEIPEQFEDQIVQKLQELISLPKIHQKTKKNILTLFSFFSYAFQRENLIPESAFREDNYNNLTPFWKLVIDKKDFLCNMIIKNTHLFEGDLSFMKLVFHLLSFDFRANYFRKKIRSFKSQTTRSFVIRRSNIIEDSFKSLMSLSKYEFLGRLSITFDDEIGVDAGGLLKDWYTNLIRSLFNENYALFVSSKAYSTFLPNPNSKVHEDHLKYFEFTGKIFAKALIENIYLDAHLATALLKKLLGMELTVDDFEEFDPDKYKSLKWILNTQLSTIPDLEMTFTVDIDNIGNHETIELIPNGSHIFVTDENKENFVQKMIEYHINIAIKDQSNAFYSGFNDILDCKHIRIFSPSELDKIICGEPIVNIDDWQNNCEFSGEYNKDHPTILMFFNLLRKWDKQDLSKLIMFITGSPQVPLGGFSQYRENGNPIMINSAGNRNSLITAHTCTNMLDMPKYQTEEEMNSKLLLAIKECNSFGFM